MTEIQVQDDIDAHARLIGRVLNYLRYLRDIREEAAGFGVHLTGDGWHNVPRDVFDAAGGVDCELTEWRGHRSDGKTYWSKKVQGFYLYTEEPPSARSREPERINTGGAKQIIISDVCEDCGDVRWHFSGDQNGGSPVVKTCERCGKDRPV